MDAARVFKVLSLIPDRTALAPSGSACSAAHAAASNHPERVAFILRRQHWLGPLEPVSREEQRMLGLQSPHARPVHATGEEELEVDGADAEESALDEQDSLELDELPALEEEPASHATL